MTLLPGSVLVPYRYWYPGTRVLSTEVDLIRLRPSLNIVNTLVYVYSSVPIRYNSGTGMDFLLVAFPPSCVLGFSRVWLGAYTVG